MMATTDMSTPVTRGELRAEFEQFEQKFEQKLEQKLNQKFAEKLAPLVTKAELEERLAPLATKIELEHWGGALLARITAGEQRTIRLEHRIDELGHQMIKHIEGSEQRLLTELARHAQAIQEAMSTHISVIDEKYADLPARVKRLETRVFRTKGR